MRTLLLTLIVFVVAGLSLVVSQMGIPQVAQDVLNRADTILTFEPEPTTEETPGTVAVYRASPRGVLLINSATPTQTARFRLPVDTSARSGSLELKLSSQIVRRQNSMLRIMLNGQLRAEMLLRPGSEQRTVTVSLTPQDLAADQLAVRLNMVGLEETGMCTTASAPMNIVEVEQESRILLDLDTSRLSARDKIAIHGNRALVGWTNLMNETQRKDRWVEALTLAKRGHEVRFSDGGLTLVLSEPELTQLLDQKAAPLLVGERVRPSWPEFLVKPASNSGKRNFTETTTWRHWFHTGRKAHRTAPASLDYDLLLSPLPDAAKWTVTISHNGSILDLRQLPGNIGSVTGSLSLADIDIQPSNVIEIEATSSYEATGLCNNGPRLFGELRPDTRLVGGGDDIDHPLDSARRALEEMDVISVTLPTDMSLIEAQRSLELANEFLPDDAKLELTAANSDLFFLRRADLPQGLSNLTDTSHLAWLDPAGRLVTADVNTLRTEGAVTGLGAIALVIPLLAETRQANLGVR